MLHTPICDLLGIRHPIVLGGMGTATNPELVAAVTNAGGLGIMSASHRAPATIASDAARIRALTSGPFGLNQLLFELDEASYGATLEARPSVLSTAWPWPEQDLRR